MPAITPHVDDRPVVDIVEGLIGFQAVLVAHDLGLFRMLEGRPRTLSELCAAAGLSGRAGEALVAVCAAAGLLERNGREEIALTAASRHYLLPSSPTYMGAVFDMLIDQSQRVTFSAVRNAVLADRAQGRAAIFEDNAADPGLARAFTAMMHAHSVAPAMAWPSRVDLEGCRTMLDVGGGSGAHAIAAAQAWPALHSIVLDVPLVCRFAEEYIAESGVQNRVHTHAADMWRDPFPAADVHFYSDVLHDWSPERCRELLDKSYRSLPAGGRIVVHEMLLDDAKDGPFAVAASSVAMLVWCDGQQFSGPELVTLLRDAGFRDCEVVPTFGYWSAISGWKR